MTLVPYDPSNLLIEPLSRDGYCRGGLYVSLSRLYPSVLARVLVPGALVRGISPGDTVIFRPYSYEEAETSYGTIRIIHQNALQGVIEGYPETE